MKSSKRKLYMPVQEINRSEETSLMARGSIFIQKLSLKPQTQAIKQIRFRATKNSWFLSDHLTLNLFTWLRGAAGDTFVLIWCTLFYITGCNKFTAHQNAVTVEGEIFLKSGNGILPEQCKAACVAQTAFFCTAAVMRRHGACYLTGYKPKGHFMSTHFYRMCKGSAFILFYFLLYFPDKDLLITVRNSSCGNIMFS